MPFLVEEVMAKDPLTIGPWQGVREAARIMAERRIGSLVVVEDGTILGIVTSRDLRGAHPNRLVADVCQTAPLTVSPKASLLQAKGLMEEKGVERLLVVEGGRLLGLLTKAQLLYALGQGMGGRAWTPSPAFPSLPSSARPWRPAWPRAWTLRWSSWTWTASATSTSASATPLATRS
ncbi:CBS domain-containing protein [Thermus sediminis]|uniref:CBS domain-containing protein n=1 Tax=Thermus sediminis TaxID=1761908 RepID=UPI001E398A51|nr:CBS domain-containing protein [Thermus sediminis]